ncbi:hypothetical protein D3C78_1302310 [compost metagenome]
MIIRVTQDAVEQITAYVLEHQVIDFINLLVCFPLMDQSLHHLFMPHRRAGHRVCAD